MHTSTLHDVSLEIARLKARARALRQQAAEIEEEAERLGLVVGRLQYDNEPTVPNNPIPLRQMAETPKAGP